MDTHRHALHLSSPARRLATAALALCLATPFAHAATTLGAGDIAIIGYNANLLEDYSFVTLVALQAGTVIGVKESGGNSNVYTVAAGGLAAGTVVPIIGPNLGYSSAGDSLTVFQGTSNIYFSANNSLSPVVPAGLSIAAKTAIVHSPVGVQSGRYKGTRSGTRTALLTAIADTAANWDHVDGTTYALNVSPYSDAFTFPPEGPALNWSSQVVDGYYFIPPRTSNYLSAAGLVTPIRTDNNNAAVEQNCLSRPGDTIAGKTWFNVYFTNTVPAGGAITSAKLHIQSQGISGQSGTISVHTSTDLMNTRWWTGGTAPGAATSASFAWSSTESEAIVDVTSVLNTPDKINKAEFAILNAASSVGTVYFDYIWLEAIYLPSGEPVVNNTNGASSVTSTSATLNGTLTEGAPAPEGWIVWGDEIGGATFSGWDRVESLGTLGVGPFSTPINGLTPNRTYYYRCAASNSFGIRWANTNATFTTLGPTIQFTSTAAAGAETITPITVGLTLSATSALPVTVTVAATGGTALAPDDYGFSAGAVTIPAGRLTTNVVFSVVNDALNEDNETIDLGLSDPVNASLGANAAYTYTIQDNDPLPTISFGAASYNANENGGTAALTVNLGTASGRAVSVNYATSNDSAVAGSDYVATNGTLSWAAGSTAPQVITVPLLNDAAPESVETFYVALSAAANASVGGVNPAPVNIVDDDLGPPAIDNAAGASLVSSNAATLAGELLSNGGANTYVWMYYGKTDGGTNRTAWSTNAYLGITPIGVITQRVTGLTTNSTYYYRCAASNQYGTLWGTNSPSFLTGPPTVRFLATAANIGETQAVVVIGVTITNPAVYGDDITVPYRVDPAFTPTATGAGVDYTLYGTSLTIRAGQTTSNIYVAVQNDAIDETDEYVRFAIYAPTRAFLGLQSTFFLTIIDDDTAPDLVFQGTPYSLVENAGPANVRLAPSRPSGLPVSVNYATVDGSATTAAGDYTATTGKLTWAAGSVSTQTVAVPVIDNLVSTGDRYFEFRLSAPVNASLVGLGRENVTIIENDVSGPRVSNGEGASGVRGGMARLRGEILEGQPPPQASIYWGTSDGGTNPAAWARTNALGTQSASFAVDVTGLQRSTTYYYRCYAINGGGADWADSTTNFTTSAAMNYFINDAATAGDVYCTAAGNDASAGTTPAAPKASLENVLATCNLEPGDTVYMDTGAYTLANTVTIAGADAGSAAADVLIRGSTAAAGTTLDRADDLADAIFVNTPGSGYVTLEKLRITGAAGAIVAWGTSGSRANNIVIRDCTAWNNNPIIGAIEFAYVNGARVENSRVLSNLYYGVSMEYGSGATVVSNQFLYNGDAGLLVDYCTAPVISANLSGWNARQGLNINHGGGSEQVLQNTVVSNTYEGIFLYGSYGALVGNRISGNGRDGINLDWGPGFSIRENRIFRNTRYGLRALGNEGLTVRNNLLFSNTGTNAYFASSSLRMLFEHNTVYGGNGVYMAQPQFVTNRHNIVWATGSGKTAIAVANLQAVATNAFISDYNDLLATESATVAGWPEAADNAADPAYNSGWLAASGGTNLGSWIKTVTAIGQDWNNGFFIGSSTNNADRSPPGINTSLRSWGINASSNNHAVAYRLATLPAGGTLELNMDNGYIDAGNAVGFVLRTGNAASSPADYNANARFEFFFLGGGSNYQVVDSLGLRDTGVAYTATGLRLTLTRGVNDAYTLSILHNASGVTTVMNGTLGGTPNAGVDSIALYNRNAGSGAPYDLYFNSLRITCTISNAAIWNGIYRRDANSLSANPLFVDIPTDDFHLQSRAGSYHGGLWNADPTNSPCIDAGDPALPFENEPAYNGLIANLGAFGNTAEASKTDYAGALYTLTLAASPAHAGAAHVSPASALYPTNRLVTIWATATNATYEWSGWTGSFVTAENTNVFTITSNMTLTALFRLKDSATNYTGPYYTVTLARSPVEAGSVSITPLLAQYPTNILVTIAATVTNAGYSWGSWTGSFVTTAMSTNLYVRTNLNVTALFTVGMNNTNGVPGWWLSGYGIPDTQAGAEEDTDKDGLYNWQEFYAGTIPTNRLSVLAASAAARIPAQQRDSFTFQTVTGKSYRVQASTNLRFNVWQDWPAALTATDPTNANPLVSTGTVMTVYVVPPPTTVRHYRTRLYSVP